MEYSCKECGTPTPDGIVICERCAPLYDENGFRLMPEEISAKLCEVAEQRDALAAALREVAADYDGMVLMPPGLADRIRAALAALEVKP